MNDSHITVLGSLGEGCWLLMHLTQAAGAGARGLGRKGLWRFLEIAKGGRRRIHAAGLSHVDQQLAEKEFIH